jgi:hypothetical protein
LDRNLRELFGSHRRKKQVGGENYKTRNFMFWYAIEAYSLKLIYGDVLLKCTLLFSLALQPSAGYGLLVHEVS